MNAEYLKCNPVFWSRLGFCYDPPLKNEEGKPLVFTENFEKYVKHHIDFLSRDVKIHTCILHLGWMGVNEYDYSLTDRVLESVFSAGDDVLFIPRIKLNVPIDWCRENPEDVFVYYGGPQTREEIASMVGTDKQDYFGYDATNGYYRSGDYVDKRANVGGMIARQSFSSEKWLVDAGEALTRLVDRLEFGKYADRIIGYHLAYGISGETVTWGRINKRYGDYGINNRRAFFDYGLKKYGSLQALREAWCQPELTIESLCVPTPEQRTGKADTLTCFMRGSREDAICIDYDEFVSETNASALEYFAKIVKNKTQKLVGAFYGYSLYIDNAAYSGHLALERLLHSHYVDFFASPKAYARSGIGEPGGEICPAQSINLSKLFVDELDNRTYLAVENESDIKDGLVASCYSDSAWVMWRELAKDISHDSGFWWMDLGGGWFDSPDLMSLVSRMVHVNDLLRCQKHESISDMLIVFDERSMMFTRESKDLHKGFLREFINEANLSGVLLDVYRASDLHTLDLTGYRLIVFAQNFYVDDKTRDIIASLPDEVTVAFSYAAGAWGEGGFDLSLSEKLTGHRIISNFNADLYDFPMIKGEPIGDTKRILITEPYMKSSEIRAMAKRAGCQIYTEANDAVIYGDNRFLGVFSRGKGGSVKLKERDSYLDLISGTIYEDTDEIPLPNGKTSAMILVRQH
ncbi:MAG: hypothetical protein IJY69_06155 [Clostridia bacterium]|nr:hypothetical protein [Clostridia bacterium]